ncbi:MULTISPECIES: SGNH/GDSL hydrolase family protein [unclassified Streptomyces]|uniref:SGNH/GDSL hydrolase family protein n=1 Tax=unclassified Streptomyces TaxID=2593676 RepID=UPI0022B71969|nr:MULTISPECIES: SGNH/GDSL hydrolase family protein [unclassified Streptomyces]MCZ7414078.1 SGNH/GDSL hydrolase family protein [Streptomyces sp. WMMC897]MCZ7431073.1 SGNH/GDSL hydrolase family protein [Streptomyces sp. WMMC1477]
MTRGTRHRGGRTGRAGVVAAALALLLGAGACTSEAPSTEKSDTRKSYVERSPSPSPTPIWDTSPDSIAALGDSITTAFDACSLLTDCPEVSWATGTSPEVDSLADRLLADPEGRTWNYAVAGSVMADLPGQAAQAAAHRPDLVTVLIGANDACADDVAGMTPTDTFRADFRAALRTLEEKSPSTQVYVASVPDLRRLWSLGRDNALAARIWQFGICPTMLRDPAAVDEAATARRRQVSDRVDAYNDVLHEVCAAAERCRYDGGALHDYRFTLREVSGWDWFHPGEQGQAVLAELAYAGVTSPQQPGTGGR